jgi:uncharacterized protein (DUF433 family)
MKTLLNSLPPDLSLDGSGTIHVGKSRVTFDLVIEEYQNGAVPEDIVMRYSTLDLPEVYEAINWYLHQRDEAIEYLAERKAKADANRQEIERSFPMAELRERLLARWEEKKRTSPAP